MLHLVICVLLAQGDDVGDDSTVQGRHKQIAWKRCQLQTLGFPDRIGKDLCLKTGIVTASQCKQF